uniref:Transmembrane protein 72 n=1 Tax=Myotis myotis TaxID=51298 RepID=A0A7J7RMS8_MYOMY|nr:transmembrane protein 72 [Myotis myotis]
MKLQVFWTGLEYTCRLLGITTAAVQDRKRIKYLGQIPDLKSRPRRNFPPWVLTREMTLCAGRPILNTIVNPAGLQSSPCEQRHHQNLVYQRRWPHRRVLRHSRKK